MLDSILSAYASASAELTLGQLALCTGVSLALGAVCALLYMFRNQYNKSFVVTLALLPAMVQVVILLVNGNLGTGVAVMGAFSLVRFRSLPGSAREIGSIFMAMAVGLATGTGYLAIAALFVAALGAATLVLECSGFGQPRQQEQLLRITVPETLEYEGAFDDIFRKYCCGAKLNRIKTTNMGSLFELEYTVRPRRGVSEKKLIDELRCRNGNLTIQLNRTMTPREDLL